MQWLHASLRHAHPRAPLELHHRHVRADHLPPHVHVVLSDGREALVEIADLTITADRIKRREIVPALEWVEKNRAALAAKWKELNP